VRFTWAAIHEKGITMSEVDESPAEVEESAGQDAEAEEAEDEEAEDESTDESGAEAE
jgi:uncharacterized membrane-anchored protein